MAAKYNDSVSVHIGSSTEELTLSVADLVVDDTYQRPLSMSWARKIAREFDEKKFGKPLVVRRPDGKYAIIDGQHRIWALRIKWPNVAVTVKCDVLIDSATVEEQATKFLAHNAEVKKPDTGTILKAMIAEGDPDALTYRDILLEAGYRMKSGGGRATPREIHAYVFKNTKRLVGSAWADILRETLSVTFEAWGTTHYPLSSQLLGGISLFLYRFRHHENYDRKRLIRNLQRVTPLDLDRDGKSMAAMRRTRAEYGTRALIRDLYNTKLQPENRLPEFES